jgi:hypothetical protein
VQVLVEKSSDSVGHDLSSFDIVFWVCHRNELLKGSGFHEGTVKIAVDKKSHDF